MEKEMKLTEAATILKQIKAIRDSGETNMYDFDTVQFIAAREGFYELVEFIEVNPKRYWDFISSGKKELLKNK